MNLYLKESAKKITQILQVFFQVPVVVVAHHIQVMEFLIVID